MCGASVPCATSTLPQRRGRPRARVAQLTVPLQRSGAVVALDFVPRGARQDYTHLGLVVSDFVQPYGYFNGSITATDRSGVRRTVVLQEVFGVVENHYAMW